MAQHDDNQTGHDDPSRPPVALAERKKPVSDFATSSGGESEKRVARETEARHARGGFFDIYKPTQGHQIRVWSGVAYGALICWFAYSVFDKLQPFFTGAMHTIVPISVAAVIIAGFGLLGYWALGLKRTFVDFLIATEGEMKKVNWTTRREIIGSTKVVIFVMVAMSILLFVVDIVFILFFTWIGILKGELNFL